MEKTPRLRYQALSRVRPSDEVRPPVADRRVVRPLATGPTSPHHHWTPRAHPKTVLYGGDCRGRPGAPRYSVSFRVEGDRG